MTKSVRLVLATLAVLAFVNVAAAQKPGVGTWDLTTVSPEGEFKSTLVIREEGGKLKAFGKSANGERAYDSAEIEGDKVKLVVTINYNGSPMVITYTGKFEASRMGGEADYGGLATGSWAATAAK
ncbi:MAG TPA: hypothetical protein VNT81_08505 [Vicinamibacterales bacterium]|nr:hypothetical protein [Vicinamibacterales bacterium]